MLCGYEALYPLEAGRTPGPPSCTQFPRPSSVPIVRTLQPIRRLLQTLFFVFCLDTLFRSLYDPQSENNLFDLVVQKQLTRHKERGCRKEGF